MGMQNIWCADNEITMATLKPASSDRVRLKRFHFMLKNVFPKFHLVLTFYCRSVFPERFLKISLRQLYRSQPAQLCTHTRTHATKGNVLVLKVLSKLSYKDCCFCSPKYKIS